MYLYASLSLPPMYFYHRKAGCNMMPKFHTLATADPYLHCNQWHPELWLEWFALGNKQQQQLPQYTVIILTHSIQLLTLCCITGQVGQFLITF